MSEAFASGCLRVPLPRGWLLVGAMALAAGFGCEGPVGPTGPGGAAGQIGAAGSDGRNGTDGAKGADGKSGADGKNGTDGPAGPGGRNVYLTAPGLHVELLDATLADGVAGVTFKLTDGSGAALDRTGRYTEGAVSLHWVLAWLRTDAQGAPGEYSAYTTRTETSLDGATTATQATYDTGADGKGGVYADVDALNGVYRYTFAAPVHPTNPGNTHTVGVFGSRPTAAGLQVANALYHFVPAGGAVTARRDIVATATCNGCHNTLALHGGERREVGLCILCHTDQSTDADTGNTVDFRVMIHKIHRGKNLPSVKAGERYHLVGYQKKDSDFSTVAFPQDVGRCAVCHKDTAQADVWKGSPTRALCSTCHDRTSFVTPAAPGMTMHPGGPQRDDAVCAVCHPATGSLAGIADVHAAPMFDATQPKLALAVVSVASAAPGQSPVLTFSAAVNGVARDLLAKPLPSLSVTVAGPTTDYAESWQSTIQGSGAAGTLAATGTPGLFTYAFPAGRGMPATAAGTYAFGLEGYVLATDGKTRLAARNPVAFAAVTDQAAVPRRQVVETAKCEACHGVVPGHGNTRVEVQYCVMCHNANRTNVDRSPHLEGSQTQVAHSLHFDVMIHRIHRGESLAEQPYVLGGYPLPSAANPAGTPLDFGEVRFPGDLRDCETCHAKGTASLPLVDGALPSKEESYRCSENPAADADSYCTPSSFTLVSSTSIPPEAAACTACHDGPAARAHAELMTTSLGQESCATCHGKGSAFAVDVVHRRQP